MFVNALETVGGFTRPIFTIARRYGSTTIEPGSATLFFVNDEGWAVTTRRVAQLILDAGLIEKKYHDFRAERNQIVDAENFEDEMRLLETKYGYSDKVLAQMKVTFFDCVDSLAGFECKLHRKFDLAAIRLDGWQRKNYKGHAVFAKDVNIARPGKYLCRLGYPFPEFKNFAYNEENDDIVWTKEGLRTSPRFPVDGMVTRLVATDNTIAGIEMSTSGLRGINGGPLFDEKGIIYGMQIGANKLNLGQCLHVGVIKQFLAQEKISFVESGEKPFRRSTKGNLLYTAGKPTKMN